MFRSAIITQRVRALRQGIGESDALIDGSPCPIYNTCPQGSGRGGIEGAKSTHFCSERISHGHCPAPILKHGVVVMAQLIVRPHGPLTGRVRVPGDKSISNRFVILASLAEGESRARGWLASDDTLATLRCMIAMGVEAERPEDDEVVVWGRGLHSLREPSDVLYCESSGTTMRLLTGLLAGQPFTTILTGSDQLRRRPMRRVVDPLRRMGATILGRQDGALPPLAIHGGRLRGISYSMPVASAQVKSALLLAGLFAEGETEVLEPAPTRDHTERMLSAMGVQLDRSGLSVRVRPPERPLEALDVTIPGDISSAAFLLAAASLVAGSEVAVEHVGVNPTRDGFLEALAEMGADVDRSSETETGGEPVATLSVRAPEALRPLEISGSQVPRMIDEFPVFAVLATQAHGTSIVRDASELRVKESDRVATVVEELSKMGAQIDAAQDGFTVYGPTRLKGTTVLAHGDHRLAMALAVAGLIAEGETVVDGAECITKSFPGFPQALEELGADVEWVTDGGAHD